MRILPLHVNIVDFTYIRLKSEKKLSSIGHLFHINNIIKFNNMQIGIIT